jgi:bifunctional non-homologous end joining protein LigD
VSGYVVQVMPARTYRPDLRFIVFDVPILLGTDLRALPWQERRERLELLARAFDVPLELSPLVDPSVSLVEQMVDGRLEGIVLRDRSSTYRDGTRVGWSKVKDRSWYDREAWRFDRR